MCEFRFPLCGLPRLQARELSTAQTLLNRQCTDAQALAAARVDKIKGVLTAGQLGKMLDARRRADD